MKFIQIAALFVVATEAHRLRQQTHDEVDDLLAKQDEKDAKEVSDKEFNDANSKMNQIGAISKQH